MTEPRRLVVLSAGLSQPSSTRLLADRLSAAVVEHLDGAADVRVVELRDLAHDVTNAMLTGFAAPALQEVLDAVAGADGLIAVTPTFNASYSGLFKSFADLLDGEALDGTPVLLGATGGTERHSLVLDHAMRPLFSYLHADVVARGVYAASSDWGSSDAAQALAGRVDRAAGQLAQAVAARPARSRPDDDDGFVPFEQLLGG
ncbi:FMN reductase [Angustibacter aerolatus]